jgi:hypothetical protein
MMHEYDDDLDRALFALPLEPLPDGLRASILTGVAVGHRPIFTHWETIGLGIVVALGTWLALLLRGDASAGTWLAAEFGTLAQFLVAPTTLTWAAAGLAVAVCVSLASMPRRRTTA